MTGNKLGVFTEEPRYSEASPTNTAPEPCRLIALTESINQIESIVLHLTDLKNIIGIYDGVRGAEKCPEESTPDTLIGILNYLPGRLKLLSGEAEDSIITIQNNLLKGK